MSPAARAVLARSKAATDAKRCAVCWAPTEGVYATCPRAECSRAWVRDRAQTQQALQFIK